MSILRHAAMAFCLVSMLALPAFASPELPVRRFVLPNGLTVLFLPRSQAPVFTGYILARVGSVNEWPGITGGSHLLEHLMFKGTRILGTLDFKAEKPILDRIDRLASQMRNEQALLRTAYGQGDPQKVDSLRSQIAELEKGLKHYAVSDELWGIYQRHGGTRLNASTGWDSTQYHVQLPSNRFRLWAFLEADRLTSPVFREFYSERDVVREERRLRVETNPSGMLFEQFMATLHSGSPYGNPIVGWPSDLDTVSREYMLAYFHHYYAPSNLVAVVIGDLEEAEVRQGMAETFGKIPRRPDPRPVFTRDVPPTGERRVEVLSSARPQIYIGYPGPPPGHPDQYALKILAGVLSKGRTSRLHRNLVQSGLVQSMSAYMYTRALDNLFVVEAIPQAPHTVAEVEVAFQRELESLLTEPPAAWELEKVRKNLEADFVRSLNYPLSLARALAQAEAFRGTWRNYDERARYQVVTAADVQRVAGEYLTRERRTVATLVQKEVKP
ncbi:MAG: M16 family metallopeptidase [Candidatus Xenobium sp.]|jgi:predicted Zn-dependent peptidase|nr:insulinase family protein [Burkholderiales bacterium]